MDFKREFVEMFKDDYKYVGKYVVKPFSFTWWAINIGQGLLGAVGFYIFYILMWVALG